ncbi:hypothetical protein FSP39_013364 [Pinctada imbricata]|uniref:Uncharacterized protein n=1 Tax=Pinctada imbricata TaxID=66713 RepID=A0AA88Y6D2_PINIB|nr:hypothetical protein FSP39_013364 [Pinctada imbricata]
MNPVVQFSNNAVKTENLIEIKHGGNSQPIILKAGGVIKIGDTNHHSVPLAILTEKERDDEGIRISKPKPKPKPKPKKKKPQKRKKPKKNEEKPKANKTKKSTATEATPSK